MKRLSPLLVGSGTGLAAVLVLYLIFLGGSRPLVCKESQDGWRYHTGQLPPHETVGQSFTSRLDGLARIDVKLGTFRKIKVAPGYPGAGGASPVPPSGCGPALARG